MAQMIAGGFEFSPYIDEGGYKIRKVNIFEDIPANLGRVIAGYYIEIEVKLHDLRENVLSELKTSLEDETIPVTYTFCGEEFVNNFPRPEIEITAVSENPDGIYWDVILRFKSEGFYSDDRL
jgi:hypothetical protein